MNNNIFEFSRTVDLNGIKPNKIVNEGIEAKSTELEAISHRLEVKEVKSLNAEFRINKIPAGNYFQIFGKAEADLVQISVVSGEDVVTKQISEFDAMFTLEHEVFNVDDNSEEYEMDNDPFTPINRGVLDIGELALQYLALDINRYPKLENESFEDKLEEEISDKKPNPFSVLAKLKDKK